MKRKENSEATKNNIDVQIEIKNYINYPDLKW